MPRKEYGRSKQKLEITNAGKGIRMKKAFIITGSIVGGLLAVYIGVSIFFMSHYRPGTIVNSISCGGKTSAYVIDKNKNKAKSYVLTIKDRKKNQFSLVGVDYDYSYVEKGEEKAVLKSQNGFGWIKGLFSKSRYDLKSSVTFDETKLLEQLNSLELFQKDYIEQPQNAYINIDETQYEMVPEVQGNELIQEAVTKKVLDAVDSSKNVLELSDDCYVAPEILSTDKQLVATKEQIEKYLNATIHYEIDGEDENLSKEEILKLLAVGKDGSVTIKEDKLNGFVQHLATKYNTYGDVREFKTSSGDTVSVGGGDYGWIISKEKERQQILADLEKGQPVSREPVYEQRALHSGLDDIGDTYIEVDYTKQHLWYYLKGELQLDSALVSGNLGAHNGSVDGIYKIVYKERNATLNGEDYSTPVKFFMPFAYNIGFHDASWRDNFGGEIYRRSGSHGCVNLPPKKAKELFELVEKGTPVVAYYREKVTLTNTAAEMSNAYSYVRDN